MPEIPSTLRPAEWNSFIDSITSAVPAFISDVNGIILWANSEFERVMGYNLDQIVGNTPTLFKSRKQDDEFYQSFWEKISDGAIWQGEIINSHKDGSLLYLNLKVIPFKSDGKRISHYFAIYDNQTRVKIMEHKLQEFENKHRELLKSLVPLMSELKDATSALESARLEKDAILNSTSEAMVLFSGCETLIWYNQSFRKWFLLADIDQDSIDYKLMKQQFSKIFEDSEMVIRKLSEIPNVLDRETNSFLTQRWPQRRELELYTTPVKGSDSSYIGELFVFRDITREKEVERMKSEFISHITHEFRTPLTSIRGYTEMMLEGDIGELIEEQKSFLQTIHRNAKHLGSLVNDLLDVSKIESGALRIQIEPNEIDEIINDCINRLAPQIQKKNHKIKTSFPKGNLTIEIDSQRMSQILMNLISNAIKYTPSNGVISVSVKIRKSNVEIIVEDNGIGMTEIEMNQLFTKFFRAKNEHTIKESGTGLGLWITKSLIEMHGGSIKVESKVKKGSKFTILLPVRK